jgi:hypothetical protein
MNTFNKEILVPYRPEWSGFNLFKAIPLSFVGALLMSKGNYWFSIFLLYGLYWTFKSIWPSVKDLKIKNGYAWPNHLWEQTSMPYKIKGMERRKNTLMVHTEKESFKVLTKRISALQAKDLDEIHSYLQQTGIVNEPLSTATK